jgi:hypothetical protein
MPERVVISNTSPILYLHQVKTTMYLTPSLIATVLKLADDA